MTDDKRAGEGPYKIRDGFNRGVVGPGIPSGEEEYDLSPRVANMIFNEGRKAERERCANILSTVKNAELLIKSLFPDEIGGQDGE